MNSPNYREASAVLSDSDPQVLERLLIQADTVRREVRGDQVYLRGLIEFSNACQQDCLYCGLRRSNDKLSRYRMGKPSIIEAARLAGAFGMQSIALQSGENNHPRQVSFLVEVIQTIKEMTGGDNSPGLGITVSVGELDYHDYRRLWEAGAHRYLLRMETSDPQLFSRIHPSSQSYQRRLECLHALKDIGFQVGTGIMVGLPGQTPDHLLADLHFFVTQDIDMLGLGPYLPHPQTPMGETSWSSEVDPLTHTLKIMALSRIWMPDINMVASTALQTLHPQGLAWGLKAGANVVMPVLTPETHRSLYSLYTHKQYRPMEQLAADIERAGYHLGLWQWGDAPHYYRRRGLPPRAE